MRSNVDSAGDRYRSPESLYVRCTVPRILWEVAGELHCAGPPRRLVNRPEWRARGPEGRQPEATLRRDVSECQPHVNPPWHNLRRLVAHTGSRLADRSSALGLEL